MAGPVPGTDVDATTGVRVGDVVDGRYRLEERQSVPPYRKSTDGVTLWRAADLVLSRPVAIRLLINPNAAACQAFLTAATTSCRAADPLLAATYDAADFHDAHGRTGAYVVREWVDGRTLYDTLRDGPLLPEHATSLVHDVAVALAHLHDIGVVHGHIHPANVLIREDGQIRLADAGLGIALDAVNNDQIASRSTQDGMAADTRALGKTLYVALTGRWPTGPWLDLEAAPRNKANPEQPLSARQVQPGVSRELDLISARILGLETQPISPPITSATDVAAALHSLPVTAESATATSILAPVPAAIRQPMTRRRRHVVLATLGTVVVLAGAAVAGLLSAANNGAPGAPAFTPPATNGGTAAGTPISFAKVESFDPPPGDGIENPTRIDAAHDGRPTTAWQTETYATANLGNAKPGVGLLFDLGSSRTVNDIRLDFLRDGTDVDIRAMSQNASAPGTTLADFPLVARRRDTGTTVDIHAGGTSRFWLVWLTKLPPADDGPGFRGSIAEVTFTP